jgi:hypothetical protein
MAQVSAKAQDLSQQAVYLSKRRDCSTEHNQERSLNTTFNT